MKIVTPPKHIDRRAEFAISGALAKLILVSGLSGICAAHAGDPLPATLAETGLFAPGTNSIDARVLPFSPRYALWSDGATKRRWIRLPDGAAIDGSDPDRWEFPPGTRLWKEFAHGRPVETRYIERLPDGAWRFAAYVWDEEGAEARLAPASGLPRHVVADAPGGRYAIPSVDDCRACHEGAEVPVLGFSALQLSSGRDPLAPHAGAPADEAVDLVRLNELGLLKHLPDALLQSPPRIRAATATARAALGYLHANCGHCHNAGPLDLLDMHLALGSDGNPEQVLRSLVDRESHFTMGAADRRIAPGRPDLSVLALRMQSRHPAARMPPLGTALADDTGLALIERWIADDLAAISQSGFEQEKHLP